MDQTHDYAAVERLKARLAYVERQLERLRAAAPASVLDDMAIWTTTRPVERVLREILDEATDQQASGG